jgi:hypothetical protein
VGDQLAGHLAAAGEAIDSGRASALLADWADATQSA